MDEKAFFDYIDKKFEAVAGLLDSVLSNQEDMKENLLIKKVVAKKLSDFSKAPKAESVYSKEMPEQVGGYNIAKKGCNRCGGKITWDLYDKEGGHPYPDHIDESGNIIDCPEYKPKD